MKHITLFLFIITISHPIKTMDTCREVVKTIVSAIYTPSHSPSSLWISTNNNKKMELTTNAIEQSPLLIMAQKTGWFNKETRALKIGLTQEQLNYFLKITNAQNVSIIDSYTKKQLMRLVACSYALKAQEIYAYCITRLLPRDINNNLALLIFNPIQLKILALKNHPQKFQYYETSLPFLTQHKINIICKNDHFCIVTIQGTTIHNAPYTLCIVRNLQDKGTVIKQWDEYNTITCHPNKPIIVLSKIKNDNNQEIIIYNIALNTTISNEINTISSLQFSPKGNYLVATNSHDSTIMLWNSHNIDQWDKMSIPKPLYLIGHTDPISLLTFSPNEKKLVSGTCEMHRPLIIWNISTDGVVTATNALQNEHRHFKRFIFSRDSSCMLVFFNTAYSLFFTLQEDNSVHKMTIKTPSYATFDASYIPDENIIIDDKRENPFVANPYNMLTDTATNKIPYFTICTSKNGRLILTYKKKDGLTLITYKRKDHTVKAQQLVPKCSIPASITFHKDSLIFCVWERSAILWDQQGKKLFSLEPRDLDHQFNRGILTKKHILLDSIKKNNSNITYCLNVIPFYTAAMEKTYHSIATTMDCLQAIILKKLYKQSSPQQITVIPNNSFASLALKLFNEKEQELINKTFAIAYHE